MSVGGLVPSVATVFLLLILCQEVYGGGTIGLPFQRGQQWTICRGYNGPKEHSLAPVLDFSIAPNSVGNGGCTSATAYDSQNKDVIAPGAGKVYHFSSDKAKTAKDGICLDLDNGGALGILHFNPNSRWPNATRIQKGQILGTLAPPTWFNGQYSHIHIQAHEDNCRGALQAFTEANGFRFEGPNRDLHYNGTYNQWAGNPHNPTVLKWADPARWFPTTSLLQVPGRSEVWYVEGQCPAGSNDQYGCWWRPTRRHIANIDTFVYYGFEWKNIHYVSQETLDCIKEVQPVDIHNAGLRPIERHPVWYKEWKGWWYGWQWTYIREGILVRLSGSDKVYLVSYWQLHHLQMTEEEFLALGFQPSSIQDISLPLADNPNIIGEPFPKAWFTWCWNWWW